MLKRHDFILFSLPVLTALVFGIYPAASRAVYTDGGNISFLIILTASARALGLIVFCLITKRHLYRSREDVRQALFGGVFQAASIFGIIGGLAFLPGPVVIIILFSHTLMLLFFMAWKKEIKLDAVTIATTAAALIGLTLAVDFWHQKAASHWIGIALAFMSALATVSRLYVYGRQTKTRHPAVVGAETFLVTAVLALTYAVFIVPEAPHSQSGCLWSVLACFSLMSGTFGMFIGIGKLGAFRWSLFSKLEPLFTAMFSYLLLGEVLRPAQYLGIVIVLASLASYQVCEISRKRGLKPANT